MSEEKKQKERKKLPKQPPKPEKEQSPEPEIIDALTNEPLDVSISIEDLLKIDKEEEKAHAVFEKNIDDPQNGKKLELPKYDFLKINYKFIEGYKTGQQFVFNMNRPGNYDSLVQKSKVAFDSLIEKGYEIHKEIFIPPDYILFTFRLPNDKAGTKQYN